MNVETSLKKTIAINIFGSFSNIVYAIFCFLKH